MGKIIRENIELEDITSVDLLCSKEDNKKTTEQLRNRVNIHNGKNKLLTESYLFMTYLVGSVDENLKLDAIRVRTIDMKLYNITTQDIIENQIVISDNSVRFMLSILKYLSNSKEELSIKLFDYQNLDYIDYQEELPKSKGSK